MPMAGIFAALRALVKQYPDLFVVYPVHPNPLVRIPAHDALMDVPGVLLCPPLDYPNLIALMRRAHLVLTDSGGIQEEAPSLGKPVLVAHETTERPEAIEAGVARLVGTRHEDIIDAVRTLLDDPAAHAALTRRVSPFGDGYAAGRIADALAPRSAPASAELMTAYQ